MNQGGTDMRHLVLILVTILATLTASFSALAATEYALAMAGDNITYANPVWSPDGRSIAYVAIQSVPTEPPSKETSIRLATLVGGKWQHRVLVQNADRPVWSPDGKRIAVWTKGGPALVDVATSKTFPLYKSVAYYPMAWSADGRWLLLMPGADSEGQPVVRDMKTGNVLTVSKAHTALWTWDGKLVTAVPEVEGGSEPSILRITDPKTGTFRTVLKGRYIDSLFSPKGAGYVWGRMRKDAPKGEGIYRVDLKSGAILKMISVRAEELTFSPDGKQFAFLGKWAEKSDMVPEINVYLGNTQNWYFKVVSKGAMTPSDTLADKRRYISWSPDSKSIAYITKVGDIRIVKL